MKAGKFKTFKLQHGTSVREFKDVTVRHPVHIHRDKDGNVESTTEVKDRWELEGTELKVEVYPFNREPRLHTVETHVVVGFLEDNVLN